MDCPICKKPMEALDKDISHNNKNDRKYDRVQYHCPQDDVWIKTEIPQKIENIA